MSHQACPARCNWQHLVLVVMLGLGFLPLSGCSGQLRSSGPTSHGPIGTLAAEFPLKTPAGPEDIAAGPDGNLWFTEQHGGIGRITPTGAITEVALAPNSRAMGIAVGPDGNLWFTEVDLSSSSSNTPVGNGHIGRISPTTGMITEFPLPASASWAMGIAAGPDGNLWFTEPLRSKIGRITPTGTIAQFSLTTPAGPEDIAAGPDGNLWFTFTSGIGRITPTGTNTEWDIAQHGGIHDIAAGPDGNLWFLHDNHIERISPTDPINPPPATVTEFTPAPINGIPVSDSVPERIAAGPDGALWFTVFGLLDDTNPVGGRIGRISPTGTITEFALAPNSHPRGIAAGPDGSLWVTEPASNRIGQFTPTMGTSS